MKNKCATCGGPARVHVRNCSWECRREYARKHWPDRLWSKIDKRGPDDCWLWTAQIDEHGYGRFYMPLALQRGRPAHRMAWVSVNGDIGPGLEVCHRCDNPAHLFLGTRAENMADMARKGRAHKTGAQGEQHYRAKLNDEAVREIRRRAAAGEQPHGIAPDYGVTPDAIGLVVRRRSWRHVQ